jgi:cytochrome P450
MRRLTLSDGTVLPKGARLMVAARFRDAEIYPDPDSFDPTRFLQLLKSGPSSGPYQFVSTSADMFAFGTGFSLLLPCKEESIS